MNNNFSPLHNKFTQQFQSGFTPSIFPPNGSDVFNRMTHNAAYAHAQADAMVDVKITDSIINNLSPSDKILYNNMNNNDKINFINSKR
jgi:hypothetical protein